MILALALVACGDDDGSRPSAPPRPPPAPALSGDSTIAPDWLVRLSTKPVITMFRTTGPRVAGGEVVVGSTAIGIARIRAATGEVIAVDPTPEPAALPDDDPTEEIPPLVLEHPAATIAIDDQRLRVANAEVPGRFVQRPGALGQTDGSIVALRLEPAGGRATVRPVWVAQETGAIVREGAATATDGVVAADIAPAGVVAVLRFGRDLRRHQVVLWGPDGAPRWRWELPAPQQPRTDVSVRFGPDAVFVFYDGRDLARLALESPTPDAGTADAGAGVSGNPTP